MLLFPVSNSTAPSAAQRYMLLPGHFAFSEPDYSLLENSYGGFPAAVGAISCLWRWHSGLVCEIVAVILK